ncbi:L-ribulokinase AraB-like protein [Escherichia coli]|uniref:L-ribulokinase AraB-like protein n=1 Tax=Escherichia coli TaxID=562 RepID=A0A377CV39_ECOLX|nr:L-ribulokinase AraB-like protein [Escherichia coli]
MHNGYFLGVDVGSASVRAGVYSASGHRLAFATAPVSQFRPGGERVEQSSAEIWQQVCKTVKEATAWQASPFPQFAHWVLTLPARWLFLMNKARV